jgi:hypothetical protein
MERQDAPPTVLAMLSDAPYERRAAAVSALIHALRLHGKVGLEYLDGDPDEELSQEAGMLLEAVEADWRARRKAGARRFLFRQDGWPPVIPDFESYSRAAFAELFLWCLQVDVYLDGALLLSADDFLYNVWVHQSKALPPGPELAAILAEHPGTLFPPDHPALD